MTHAIESEMGPRIESPEGTEELIDTVAIIELERQDRAREAGNAAACAAALHRLRELYAGEKEALRGGPSAEHSANLAALAVEIGRVEKLSGNTTRLALPDVQKRDPRTGSRPGAPRAPVRNNGRQTGRRSG